MAEPSSLTLPQHGLEHGMKTTHHTYAETATRMDRVFSSEAIALQLLESASLHSRPGQPATPDQVLPFLNAASLHSSDAAALWRVDSRDMSASPSKPQQPARHLQEPFSTPSGPAKELRLSSKQQHAHSAHAWKRQLAATCATQQLRETAQRQDKSHRRLSLAHGGALCLQQETRHYQGGDQHPAGGVAEDLQASEHSAAQTGISQSADDEVMHCCDSMASALAPPVLAHVRSKPALPAEVTDDSEDLSNSASEKALQLSLADLKAVFGVPLTEAAARLGVQRQDLVRSCRRHNLEGWPRLFISVTEAARSDASLPTSVPSDADASDLAAFVPLGPSALRSSLLASQAHSVHTRSSSRVGGNRARASGASTRRGPASLRLDGHLQGGAAPKPSQQGSAKGGVLADPSPAATASLLGWAAAVARGTEGPSLKAMSLLLKVPAIQLDRPGMWAPKILQARAQAQEATSLPRGPNDRAASAQNAAAAEESAAAVLAAPTKHCPAAVGAPSVQGAGNSLGLQNATGASPEQASRGAAALSSQHREMAHSSERQLESRTATAHPPATSPEPEQDTAAQAQPTAVPESAAQVAAEGFPISRRVQSRPANSVPLQDTNASGSGHRRRAGAVLGALKTLSAPLILMSPHVAGDDEAAMPDRNWTAAAEAQGEWDSVQVYAGRQADQEAPAVSEHGPEIKPSPAPHEAAAAADLMCSPFMQTLALSGGHIPNTRVLEMALFIPSACDSGAASLSDHSQNSWSAVLPGKLTPADRRTGRSAELARTKSRQLSKQSPALCLLPKKRLHQKGRCGRGTPLPLGEVPAAGQSACADVPTTDARLCAAAESSVAELAMASPPSTGPGTSVAETPSAAEQLPVADDQVAEAQPVAAEQGPLEDVPATAARPRKRPGRPPGSGKAARERALELALPACSPEGKRPLKKSRKALEAEQAEEALQSLRKELPCLSAGERDAQDQCEVPVAEMSSSKDSSDRQQPEQAPAQSREEPRHTSKVQLMPQTPTSRPRFAFLGSLRLPRPDLGMIGEDMECSEKLPEHIPDAANNCHNICLNLSPPPALPGTMFCGSVCNSLLGSPLPHMDSPEYHEAFYKDAFHDLSLGNFNDLADSSFSFGCFNN